MLKAAVVADDFTGANATGVLLKKKGWNVTTLLKPVDQLESVEADIISISTNSRGISQEEAYRRVFDTTKKLISETANLAKRIDSTLRGNLGAEIDAALDAAGEGYKAVVVPAYPKSGRICVGSYLLVGGIPLHLTEVAKDPKCPIKSSNVKELISLQSKRSIATISLGTVAIGKEAILRAFINEKADIIVFDAVTDDDITTIASALKDQNNIICVDPGPFTAAFVDEKLGQHQQGSVFLIIGSVSELTTAQVNYLLKRKAAYIYKVNVQEFLNDPSATIKTALDVLNANYESGLVMGVTTKGDPSDVLDLKTYSEKFRCGIEEISDRINSALSEIAFSFIKDKTFKSLYITGGDTALAFFNMLGVSEFSLQFEVLPLAVHGIAKVGSRVYNIVTKGGLVGNEEALYDIVSYLESLQRGA